MQAYPAHASLCSGQGALQVFGQSAAWGIFQDTRWGDSAKEKGVCESLLRGRDPMLLLALERRSQVVLDTWVSILNRSAKRHNSVTEVGMHRQ